MSSVSPFVTTMAQRFLDRAEALNYRGKQKTDAAIDYLHGALLIAEHTDKSLAIEIAGLLYEIEHGNRGWQRLKEVAFGRQYA